MSETANGIHMNITAEQIITDLIVEIYKRDAAIKELKIRNQELREKNELLEEKRWDECHQIALYDDESKKLKRTDTIHDFARMCNSYCDCAGCPMRELRNGFHGCDATMRNYPEKVSEVVSKWCAEHPEQPESVSEQPKGQEKTKRSYKEDFLEKFPNAMLEEDGEPQACKSFIYGNKDCGRTCSECWNEVMKDE